MPKRKNKRSRGGGLLTDALGNFWGASVARVKSAKDSLKSKSTAVAKAVKEKTAAAAAAAREKIGATVVKARNRVDIVKRMLLTQ